MKTVLTVWVVFLLGIAIVSVSSTNPLFSRIQSVEYLFDQESKHTIESVTKQVFSPVRERGVPAAYNVVWIKLPLNDSGYLWNDDSVLFSGSTELVPAMKAYLVKGESVKYLGFCEIRLASFECELPNLQYAFPVKRELIGTGDSAVYLRAEPHGMAMNNEFYLMSRAYYNKVTAFLTYLIGFSNAVCLLIGLAAFMIFATYGQKEAVVFGIFSIGAFLTTFFFRGVWDAIKPYDFLLDGVSIFPLVFGITRALEIYIVALFFSTKKNHRILHKLLLAFIALSFAVGVGASIPQVKTTFWNFPIMLGTYAPMIVILLLLFFSTKNRKEALPFLLSWTMGVASMLIMLLHSLQVINDHWALGYAGLVLRPISLVLVSHLVFSKLRTLATELEFARQKEQQSNIVRMLLRTLAHDLSNTTLVTRLAAENASNSEDLSFLKRSLQSILRSAQAQEDIIKNAKEAYLVRGGRALQVKPVDLVNCLEECLELLQFKFISKGVEIHREYESKETLVLAESVSLTHQVLANLIDNAVKFTPSGNKIKIGIRDSDGYIHLQIDDEGIGMPEDLKHNIFYEPRKISRPGTEGEAGTGMGLLVVRDFVAAYRAHIDVKSEPNRGTKFLLKFHKAGESIEPAHNLNS